MGIHDQDKKRSHTTHFLVGSFTCLMIISAAGIFMLGILYEPGEQGCH